MLDWGLIWALGFLGSFGHCAGMCGPLAVAFALSGDPRTLPQAGAKTWWQLGRFHLLLNLGRIFSYAVAGGAIGSLGSLLVAGGQLTGIDSPLRQSLSVLTGLMLIWFGLAQVRPQWLPRLPLWHPLARGPQRDRLEKTMLTIAGQTCWWMPLAVGLVWGLIPCGFLYAAQIKAAETGSAIGGSLTMLVFGLGTLPTMVLTGAWAGSIGQDRRSQLFRMAGWVTIAIGLLTLGRTSAMQDLTGYGSLVLLSLSLIARPISRLWAAPLRYRRAVGVGAWLLALAHTGHMLDHSLDWDWEAVGFLHPRQQVGIWAGVGAIGLLTLLALTSFDRAMRWLGSHWRTLHLAAIPALVAIGMHMTLAGGPTMIGDGGSVWRRAMGVGCGLALVLLMRVRWFWQLWGLGALYHGVAGASASLTAAPSQDFTSSSDRV
ncbi:urease accessory protein UreH domain-containing protein [Limnothrix redekei]|uniref:Sulfite exporter TauE/SafE family protein n=1 Tax=Limnothrix redekei LRLZ20PSL1 TaxID=3112953 RepID=A0ABW7CE54_9CYAN